MVRLSPNYLFLNYTSTCNSRCTTCDLWRQEGITLPVDVFKRAGRFLDPVNLASVLLCGGEPLLPDSAVDMAVAINEFKPGVAIPMATNALMPRVYASKVMAMQAAGCKPSIYISLNGRPDTHDKTRGMIGSYDRCIQFAALIKPTGALRAFNILMIPGVTTNADVNHAQSVAHQFGVWLASSPIMRTSPWFGKEDDGQTIPRFDCHVPNVLVIMPSGDIVPCHEPRPELTFGNLRDECFDEVVVQHHLEVIKSGGCQPCGICSNAFTEGAICY